MYKHIFKLIISILLLLLIFNKVDGSNILIFLKKISFFSLTLILILLYVHLFFHSVRWYLILKRIKLKLSLRLCFIIWSIAAFFNQFIPTGFGGDFIKYFYITKLGSSKNLAIKSIIIDRFLHLFTLTIIFSSSYLFYSNNLLLTPFFIIFFYFIIFVICNLLSKYFFFNHKLYLLKYLNEIFFEIDSLFKSFKIFIINIFMSLITHLSMFLSYCLLVYSLDINLTFLEIFIAIPIISIASMIPISFSGWGVRELATIYVFNTFGLGPEESFAISIIMGILIMITRFPGFFIWILNKNKTKSIELK